MGFLKLLLNANNAEGIREAMRMSYKKHRQGARPLPDGTTAHAQGLFGAMATRVSVNGLPSHEPAIWMQIAPFLLIADDEVGREALAEYAVYLERPVDAKVVGLKTAVNEAFRRGEGDPDVRELMANPLAPHLRWWALLDEDVKQALADRAL